MEVIVGDMYFECAEDMKENYTESLDEVSEYHNRLGIQPQTRQSCLSEHGA